MAVCFYVSTFLKYLLITVAFHAGYQIVYCYLTTSLMVTGLIGCIILIPAIFLSLKDADFRHILIMKGALKDLGYSAEDRNSSLNFHR